MSGKDREKELARRRYERRQQQAAQQAAQARRAKIVGGVVAAAAVIAAGAGAYIFTKDDDKSTTVAATDTASPGVSPSAAAKPGECLYEAAAGEKAAKDVGKPPVKPEYKGAVEATLKTSVGELKFDLDGAKAPCTVNSFAFLAKKGYFDKTECHRLTDKVLQCGDPAATGMGGPGYQFANENPGKYTKGVLAMANAGAGTNGSQFFIVYEDWSDLPPDYSIFGKVSSGLDKIEEVAKAGSEPAGDGKPKKKVEINSISIAKK